MIIHSPYQELNCGIYFLYISDNHHLSIVSNAVLRLTFLKLTHSDVMEGVPKFPFIVHVCRCSLILKCQGFISYEG